MENPKKILSLSLVALLWGALLFSGALGCDIPAEATDAYCEDQPMITVAGQWELMGSGSRSGCSDERLNADKFTLSSLPFDVAQVSTGTGVDTLELASQVSDSFQLKNTRVEGACVSFTTLERTAQGTLSYDWTGSQQSDGSIRGTFTSFGPAECAGSGTFTLIIKN